MKVRESIISHIHSADRITRIVAGATLFFFSWMNIVPAAAAIKDEAAQRATPFHGILPTITGNRSATNRDIATSLEDLLNERLGSIAKKAAQSKVSGQRVDYTSDRQAIGDLRGRFAQQDQKVLLSFREDLAHIQKHHLPQVVRQRYDEAQAQFQRESLYMQSQLTAMQSAAGEDLPNLAHDLAKHIISLKAGRLTARKTDPHNLPFRVSSGKVRRPRQSKEQFAFAQPWDQMPIASDATMGLFDFAALLPVTPVDLQPTTDAQITPDIQSMATSLGNNPVQIFDWVYNNVVFVPTYGSLQGSEQTLQTLRGNAFDTSSLLIALLRAANIPARYAMGTIQVPVAQVENWVGGATNPETALQILGQGGIPCTGLEQGGQIQYVQLEHVWVEAYLNYEPGRGATQGGSSRWVALDPSFKQYTYSSGANVVTNPPFNVQQQVDQIVSAIQYNSSNGEMSGVNAQAVSSLVQSLPSQLTTYINSQAQNGQGVLSEREIVPTLAPVLASGLPYTLVTEGAVNSGLPSSAEVPFEIDLYDEDSSGNPTDEVLTYSTIFPAVAGKSILLSFKPATAADATALQSYYPPKSDGTPYQPTELPQSIPGYLINVTAQLSIGGQVVASGGSFPIGEGMQTVLSSTLLSGSPSSTTNEISAGDLIEIGLDVQGFGMSQLTKDPARGAEAVLLQASRAYWEAADLLLETIQDIGIGLAQRQPSYGAFSAKVTPVYDYGVPTKVITSGIRFDVNASVVSVQTNDNSPTSQATVVQMIGTLASDMEHEIPDDYLRYTGINPQSISAVKALALSAQANVPWYAITSQNLQGALASMNLPETVTEDIENSVNAGLMVLVPSSATPLDGTSFLGYEIIDPSTGSGAYRLVSGANGGEQEQNDLGSALVAVGIGITNVQIPAASADSGQCGQPERVAQPALFSMIAFAALLIIIGVILTAGTDGVAAPAGVKLTLAGIAALVAFFVAMDTAVAGGFSSCPVYNVGTTAKFGLSIVEVNQHISDGIGVGGSNLTYTGPLFKWSRGWLRSTPECNAQARAAYKSSTGVTPHCDEYPFASSYQGGQANYAKGTVSLRLLSGIQNSAQGVDYFGFLMACGISPNTNFKINPVSGPSSGISANGEPCY